MIMQTIEVAKHVHAKNKTARQRFPGANAEIKVIENNREPADREISALSRPYPISLVFSVRLEQRRCELSSSGLE
jgi:hypothetical protein